MVDREKVIRELEDCSSREAWKCSTCKWYDENSGEYFTKLAADALSLLKAQEPRVMTLEEMKAIPYDADIWIETEYYVGKITIFAATINTKGLRGVMVYASHKTYDYEGYNKLWRCWTSRPTDEQRKATPWAEPPKEET